MSKAMARESAAVVAFLDAKLGKHAGTYPNLTYFCFACVDRKGSETDEKKLRIDIAKGKAFCHRCQYAAGSLDYLLKGVCGGKLTDEAKALIEYVPQYVAPGKLEDEVLVQLYSRPAAAEEYARLKRVVLPKEYIPLFEDKVPPLARWGYNYAIKTRGLDPSKLRQYRIGFCATGLYAGRLVFPVFQGGTQVYFTTRFCGDHHLKSLNPPNVEGYYTRNHCLLNYDGCVGSKVVGIVEGPLDTTAGTKNFPHVGTMGKGVDEKHIELFERLAQKGTEEFVIGIDMDANRDAYNLYQSMVFRLPKVTRLRLGDKDPFDARDHIEDDYAKRNVPTIADAVSGLSAKRGWKALTRR